MLFPTKASTTQDALAGFIAPAVSGVGFVGVVPVAPEPVVAEVLAAYPETLALPDWFTWL
jgi:hypothetical protein